MKDIKVLRLTIASRPTLHNNDSDRTQLALPYLIPFGKPPELHPLRIAEDYSFVVLMATIFTVSFGRCSFNIARNDNEFRKGFP